MPRQSAASRAVQPLIDPTPYPPPPGNFTPTEAALWWAITHSKDPAWWDGGNVPMLAELIRHIETFEQIQTAMREPFDLRDDADLALLERLTKLRDHESKSVASLSTKLRLSNQSRYTAATAHTAHLRGARGAKPWEFTGDNAFANNGKRPDR